MSAFGLTLVGLLEAIAIGYFFGTKKLREDVNSISEVKIGTIWDFSVKFITPAVLIISLVLSILSLLTKGYGGYPSNTILVGLCVYLIGIGVSLLLAAAKNGDEAIPTWVVVLLVIFTLLIPLVVGMMVFSEFTLTLLYGREFAAGANVLRVLLIAMLFRALAGVNNSIFAGIGRPDVRAKLAWMAAAVGIAAIAPLVWLYGAMGAASGLLVACVVWALAGAYFVTRLTDQAYPFPIFWRPLLATGAMLLFVIPMRFVVGNIFQATLVGLAGLVIYAYAFLRLGGIGRGDLKVLERFSSDMGKPRAVERVIRFLRRYA